MDALLSMLMSVGATLIISIITWFAGKAVGARNEHKELLTTKNEFVEMSGEIKELISVREDIHTLLVEHEKLMEFSRNQAKDRIVEIYQTAVSRGYITPLELDTVNRLADSYFALGGNHYIHALVGRMNEEMKIVGEPIPE